ncbi:AAA family ATPase, partial [Candidatus Aerophobetes bacterium]|nr:AAA family ATPase [Candidatus Aerophobetes bacterium]
MRIKEISVREYGPLRDFHIICTDINLIFGRNEAGKTALVDAITDALFRGRSIFPQQERFRLPSSSLKENVRVLLEHSGKEYTFPGKKRFEEITNLPHYHLARLFIVRAGELDFKRDDEKWQEKVQEFLSGIPVKIERIKEKIAEEVGITPKGEWSDRKPECKKSKVKKAEDRKNELTEAISRLQDIREKEKKLKEKKEEEKSLREKREKIALLRSYLRAKKIKEAFENWRGCRMELLNYERYLEEDKRVWQEEEEKLQQLLLHKNLIESQKKDIEKELFDLKEQEELLEDERKKLLIQKDRIVALSLSEDARKLSYSLREIEEKSERMLTHLILGILLSISGLLLFFLTILKNFGLRGVFFFLSLFFLGGMFLFFWHLTRRKYLSLKSMREKIFEKAKAVFEEVKSLEDIFKKADSLETGISVNQEKLSYVAEQKKKLKERLEDITSTLQRFEEDIKKSRERIKVLQEKTGLFTLSQLE